MNTQTYNNDIIHNLNREKSKVITLRELELFKPIPVRNKELSVVPLAEFQKEESDEFFASKYFRFPLIVLAEGCLWSEGCLFLLSFLKGFYLPSYRTLECKAGDLKYFHDWTVNEEIDYLETPKSALLSPLAKFQRHMSDCIDERSLSSSLALRRYKHTEEFYRWLIKEGKCSKFRTEIGTPGIINSNRAKIEYNLVKSKRSAFAYPKNDTIIDEGICRPLSTNDQHCLNAALIELDNPEMLLSFLLALTTGGRLCSIFTLRQKHFVHDLTSADTFQQIPIGADSLADNKNNKNMLLTVPAWLYKRVQLYLRSHRGDKRKRSLKGVYEPGEEYVFITSRGNPYYYSKKDINKLDRNNDFRGDSVRKFIKNQLLPKMRDNNCKREIGFHDLRATYGVNLVHLLMKQLDKKILGQDDSEFFYILNFVKQRMGHASIVTTMRYLRFKTDQSLLIKIQEDYEAFLFGETDA